MLSFSVLLNQVGNDVLWAFRTDRIYLIPEVLTPIQQYFIISFHFLRRFTRQPHRIHFNGDVGGNKLPQNGADTRLEK